MGQRADKQFGSNDLGTKLNTSQQSVLAANTAISTLGCFRERANEGVDPSYSKPR